MPYPQFGAMITPEGAAQTVVVGGGSSTPYVAPAPYTPPPPPPTDGGVVTKYQPPPPPPPSIIPPVIPEQPGTVPTQPGTTTQQPTTVDATTGIVTAAPAPLAAQMKAAGVERIVSEPLIPMQEGEAAAPAATPAMPKWVIPAAIVGALFIFSRRRK